MATYFTVTGTAFPRPFGAVKPEIQFLYQQCRDKIEAVSGPPGPPGPPPVLSNVPITGSLDFFKNGLRLDEGTEFTVDDLGVVTLTVLAVVGDIFHAHYHFRSTRSI